MKTKILFFCMITTLTSCHKNRDTLMKLEMGDTLYISRSEQFIKQKIFTRTQEDSTIFKYFFPTKDRIHSGYVILNPDNYYGSLRQIRINLGGDTVFSFFNSTPSFRPGRGIRLKSEVDAIYNFYTNNYGKPDSIKEILSRGIQLDFGKNDTILPTVISKWFLKDFYITFYRPKPFRSGYKNNEYVYDEKTYVQYEINNYSSQLHAIQESIRLSLKPNDMIRINFGYPYWETLRQKSYSDYNDRKFKVELRNVFRKDREEPRRIVALKYDLLLLDRFDTELYRFKDNALDLSEPLSPRENASLFMVENYDLQFTSIYYSGQTAAKNLEQARRFAESSTVTVQAYITAIVFEDGKVLKDK
jgi:hypothetical protein